MTRTSTTGSGLHRIAREHFLAPRLSVQDSVMILTDGGTTAEWLTGIVVAVTPGTPTPYDVRLNANGMVLQRISPARLALIGTAGRIAPLTDLP